MCYAPRTHGSAQCVDVWAQRKIRLFTHTHIACPIFGSNWHQLYCFSHQTADFRHSLSRNRSKIATAPRRWHKVRAQRKIPVVFNFPHHRHKVGWRNCQLWSPSLRQDRLNVSFRVQKAGLVHTKDITESCCVQRDAILHTEDVRW